MFEATLDLGKISVIIHPYFDIMPPIVGNTSAYTDNVRGVLAQQGLSPNGCLLRGGFLAKEDLDLIVEKGSDYHGRVGRSKPDEVSGVDFANETYAASIGEIGHWDRRIDPLWNALRFRNEVHAVAVYDAKQMELARKYGHIKTYRFKHPRKKLQSLLGILHLEFEA